MGSKLQQILKSIGKVCQESTLTEAEVEKVFQEKGFFSQLGYEAFGKDLLAQRSRFGKRFDVALLGFGGRIYSVIEFKQKTAGPLESFRDQLYDKYVKPYISVFGVLTDGVDFLVYARSNGLLVEQIRVKLQEITEEQARNIENWLKKKRIDLESLESVSELLRYHRQNQLLISDPQSEPARIFFQVFQLSPLSAFGRLVQALKELLPKTATASRFTRGSYEFWLKTYARELKYKDTPESWRDFLGTKSASEISLFSFSLETAYTIVSRLMLAKAADDRGFPGVRFVPRIQESLNELAVRDRVRPENYLEIVGRSFRRASDALFSSIFLQDIFDWWFECQPADSRALHFALGEAILAVTQFDFFELSGDLLGELYQLYFDRDTRKALGEFYTPAEVIEFILDECGYKGQRGDRLLDPACGSGSFLAASLRRYLHQQSGSNAKQVLTDLTEGLRIVGFDINPFAVLMAQVNYAALVLPLYAEAIHEDPDFRIVRLPVFRTDSLRIEEREEEGTGRGREGLQVSMHFEEGVLNLSIYLPVKGEKKPFHRMFIRVPRYRNAREQSLVTNLEEYITALARVFEVVRDRRHSLEALLRGRFKERTEKLEAYLQPTLKGLEEAVADLKDKYEDGRFLKAIEDLVLAVSLKHDLQYDFVVGNPPYVRIQKIPEHVKEYWEGKYDWAEHNFDLYIPFLERAVQSAGADGWLGKKGRLGFILSDRFLNVEYGTRLREHMPDSLRLLLLFDFRDTRVFAEALNYPAILIAERGNEGKQGQLQAARVFTSDADSGTVFAEFRALRKKLGKDTNIRGDNVEVFEFPRTRLTGPGWWIMPADERGVFDKLQDSHGKRLIDLSASQSGAFQGYATGADPILVFGEVEQIGDLIKVLPRHQANGCGCGTKPIELEKGAIRPFLFGKDVGRWLIDWKRTWVMFPYDLYEKKRTLQGDILEDWNLIPCKANLAKFELLHPERVALFEDRYPKAWKYLCRHEDILRSREDNRYAKDETDGLIWYGAARPQNLSYFFQPKLVLQLLSRRTSFALDKGGQFVFQAGGKGGGVYGIALSKDVGDLRAMLSCMNSNITDFIVKEISSVYGGRFYSYADQFLRNLRIAEDALEGKSQESKRLCSLAEKLTTETERKLNLIRKSESFPQSFQQELHQYEFDSIKNLSLDYPKSSQIAIAPASISVERTLYGFAVHYGTHRPFDFREREHAECFASALRNRKRNTLPLIEALAVRLPIKTEGCRSLLALLKKAHGEIAQLSATIQGDEDQLNTIAYKFYRISGGQRSVIDDFLKRYSSSPTNSSTEHSTFDSGEPAAEE